MIRYRIRHTSTYAYEQHVALCHNEAHLVPRCLPYQLCHESKLLISPEPAFIADRDDFFGNRTTYFAVQIPHKKLEVTSICEVLRGKPAGIPAGATVPGWEAVREQFRCDSTLPGEQVEERELRQYVLDSPMIRVSKEMGEFARRCFPPGCSVLQGAENLMLRIYKEFKFDPRATTIATPLTTVLMQRRGVCQDFAQLMIGCIRSLGLPARYVSGYLETVPPPGKQRQVGADASHAWVSVFAPGLGWFDYDPTNGCSPGERHITVSWGRDYGDISPLKGVIFGGGRNTLKVAVDVERISNHPVSQDDIGAAI